MGGGDKISELENGRPNCVRAFYSPDCHQVKYACAGVIPVCNAVFSMIPRCIPEIFALKSRKCLKSQRKCLKLRQNFDVFGRRKFLREGPQISDGIL